MPETPVMLTTEDMKKLILRDCPPKTDAEKVWASLVLALSERVDLLQNALKILVQRNKNTDKTIAAMAKLLVEGGGAVAPAGEQPSAEASAEAEAGTGEEEEIPMPDVVSGPPKNGGGVVGAPTVTPNAPAATPAQPAPSGPEPSRASGPLPKKAAKNGAAKETGA